MSSLKKLMVAAVAAAVVTPGAMAFSVNIEKGKFQVGSGGEFVALTTGGFLANYDAKATQTVVNNANQRVIGFGTFCLEANENLNYSDTYTGVLNQRAMNGGTDNNDPVGAGPAGDPISKGTAWLYSQFAKGVLANYNYGTDPYSSSETVARKQSAAQLQSAIWYLEDEVATYSNTNPFIVEVISKFGTLAAAQVTSNGAYGVSAINLTLDGNRRQDVLVYTVPDGGMALGLLGGGVLGLAWVQRRKTA